MGKKSQRKALAAMKKGKVTAQKNQHSSQPRAKKTKPVYIPRVARPFEGMKYEVELAALRELIPAGWVKIHTTKEYGDTDAYLVSIAPQQAQGAVTKDGRKLVALQTNSSTGDASHDIALILEKLIDAEPETVIQGVDVRTKAPRLQDMIADELEFSITEDLSFWFSEDELNDPDITSALQQMAQSMVTTTEVEGVRGAFIADMTHTFVRWVRPEDEDAVFAGLARLLAKREAELLSGARCIGAFRMLGLAAPVWQLEDGTDLAEVNEAAAKFDKKLSKAIADDSPLTPEERRARDGFIARQVSIT